MSNLDQFMGGVRATPERFFAGYGSSSTLVSAATIAQLTSANSSQSTGLATNTIYFVPFYIKEKVTITGMSMVQGSTSNNTKNIRFGIYSDSNGVPDALLVQAEMVIADAGINLVRTVALSQVLSAGVYWTAIVTNGTINTTTISIGGTQEGITPCTLAHTYAALPATAAGCSKLGTYPDSIGGAQGSIFAAGFAVMLEI